MNYLNKISACIIITITLFIFKAQAQVVYAEINGQPVMIKSYTDIEGSPYLTDDWVQGDVVLANGHTHHNVSLKYNELDDQLYFKGKSDETLVFADPVSEFTLNYPSAKKHFITTPADKAFYEVLADGNVRLLKKTAKYIQESKDYNAAKATKTFKETQKYFLITGGKLIPIKNDKKTVLTAIGNKQAEMEAYIKANHLNLKDDEGLASLINYYNSL